jgi:hypothetical protein
MLGVVKSVEVVTLDVTSGLTSLGTNLSKGQNVDNCVPFLTQQNVNDTYAPDRWLMDVYFSDSPARVTVERTTTGSRIICVVVVVEFDPNRVRVQQKSFTMPLVGGTSVQTVNVNLDYEITANRAAMVHHYRQASGTETHATDWAVRRNFNGTTQAQFVRRYSDATSQSGHFYVFESLDGAFTTQYVFMDMNSGVGYDSQTITEANLNKSWLVPHSFYSTRTHAEADSNFILVKFQNSTTVEAFRRGTTSYVQITTWVIKHHDETHVDHGQFDFDAGDPTHRDHQDSLPDAVDLNYAAPISTARDGMVKNTSAYAGTNYARYFARVWYQDDSTIRAYRQNGSEAAQLRWQSIEFAPAPGYYVGGYVTEEGAPVVRTVRSYRKDTGAFLNETTSSGIDGYFYLETSYSGAQYVVCLDDPAGLDFNALIYDSILPTTISGG